MSMDVPATLEPETVESAIAPDAWVETALTVLVTAATILFVSFVAVMVGLA